MILVYAGLICIPYTQQGGVTEQTKQSFSLSDFYSDSTGNEQARILMDNEDALEARIRLIAGASDKIILSTFEFRDDNSGQKMIAALYDAARRGVDIQILTDGIPYVKSMLGNSDFQALGCLDNVTIKVYNPVNLLKPAKLMARLHDKYLIVDEKAYILGGRNTYDYFLGDETNYKNYDWDIYVTTMNDQAPESLKSLNDYFLSVWNLSDSRVAMSKSSGFGVRRQDVNESASKLKKLYAKIEQTDWIHGEEPAMIPVNKITLLSNPIHASVKEPVLFYQMTELMKETEGDVTFHTPYILCNDYMLDRLTQICDSDKSVYMMTNSVANNGNPFGATDYELRKQDVLDTGVQVLEYDKGVSYHGKCFTIGDDLLAIGSFNWDMRSAYLDTELMLVIDSPNLNRQMKDCMEEYQKDALKVIDKNSYALKDGQKPRVISKKRKLRKNLLKPVDGIFRFLF